MEQQWRQSTPNGMLRQKLGIKINSAAERNIFSNFHNYPKLFNLFRQSHDDYSEIKSSGGAIQQKSSKGQQIYPRWFENWSQTVKIACRQILFPADVPAKSGKQVEFIQKFVRENAGGSGSRIRGSATRHSWGNIFSDPGELLVSFYPQKIVNGSSFEVETWARQMVQLEELLSQQGIEHLCLIRKVGEFTEIQNGVKTKKSLIKIGAGVSNEQMRIWCIKNGYQYKSNAIMVEVNVVGAIGTCSHGAGINTQTLSDYIYEVEFIDHRGNRQIINKNDHPSLIKSAASNLGLLGLTIFVTLEMEDLQIVEFQPRISYKDYIIPWPKDYAKAAQRRARLEYQEWLKDHNKQDDWDSNFKKFKQAINKSYCEWFYLPLETTNIIENCWQIFGKKTPENLAKIKQINGVFQDEYPTPFMKKLSRSALSAYNLLINNRLTQGLFQLFILAPFIFFPEKNVFVNYPDAVHFQRGIQNVKVRDFEALINIPTIVVNGIKEPDYNLIQHIWWTALEIVQAKSDTVNITLEMRIFKGSQATLAPENGFEYACSIQFVRSIPFGDQQKKWRETSLQIFNAWKGLIDSNGRKITIRPHWGKEWDFFEMKQHILNDEAFKIHVRKFLSDYEKVALIKGFDMEASLHTFSNQTYRDLLNNAIGTLGSHIR